MSASSTDTPLLPIADGGLGQQLRTWLDIVAVWDAAPAALLREEVDLLCRPPSHDCDGGLLGALVQVLMVLEEAKGDWSSRMWRIDNRESSVDTAGTAASVEAVPGAVPGATDGASLRVLQALGDAASLFVGHGVPGCAAWDMQGLRAAKFAPVLAGKPPVPAVVSPGACIAQRQLVPATATEISPFLTSVIEALQRHVARCNMPRPSECTRELGLMCDVISSVDPHATMQLREQVQLMTLTHSTAATYVRALHKIAAIIADSMYEWAAQLAEIREKGTLKWFEVQAYIANRSSMFIDESSICAEPPRGGSAPCVQTSHAAEADPVRSEHALDAAMQCYGFRCVLALVNANISVMAGKWDSPPSDYSYELTSMATWTAEMRRWVVLLLGDMSCVLDLLVDLPKDDCIRKLATMMQNSVGLWGDQDATALASMKQLFANKGNEWREHLAALADNTSSVGTRGSLPLGWDDLQVSPASMATSTPYDEMLTLMGVIVRNERAIIGVMQHHNSV
jgi:hypothetical protein